MVNCACQPCPTGLNHLKEQRNELPKMQRPNGGRSRPGESDRNPLHQLRVARSHRHDGTQDRQTDRQRCAYKPNRHQCKADALPGSPHCGDHQDVETKPPPAPKITHRGRPPRAAAKVAAVDPIGEIDAAIAKRLAEIETLKAAKTLIES